jgi:hypothetical protein
VNTEDLARLCAEETSKYFRKVANDTRYCMELLRRALVDFQEEALNAVRLIYEPQLHQWIYRHPQFEKTREDVDFFSSGAFSKFYFALRGPKFLDFPSLAHVLQYMKSCVHTAIASYVRDQSLDDLLPESFDIAQSSPLNEEVEADRLWQTISSLLPDEVSRLLARCVFVWDMKPREIVAHFPELALDEHQISTRIYRIRQMLRSHDVMAPWKNDT